MSTIHRHGKAVIEALEVCYLHGLNWKDHILPKKRKGIIVGLYILDETKSTVIETINI